MTIPFVRRNLGMESHCFDKRTSYDHLLTDEIYSYLWRVAECDCGAVGLPEYGEFSYEEMGEALLRHKKNIRKYAKARNEELEKIGEVSRSCFITEDHLENIRISY